MKVLQHCATRLPASSTLSIFCAWNKNTGD
jgi:hypothetical protein